MRPVSIPRHIKKIMTFNGRSKEAATIYIHQKYAYKKFFEPEISILIPVYNKERSILYTLYSLCLNNTKRPFEIIVINNNSTDNTETIAKATGVRYVNETVHGIAAVRNAGLGAAKGKYILNADAETIYPKDWIEEMVTPLEKSNVSITYGGFAFLPPGKSSRISYFLYEHIADISRYISKKMKDEAVNVYGFNFGFRRVQALAVDWFSHPKDANEDGWMAVKLRDKGFGKLHCVKKRKALVWLSSDRLLQGDGLWRGFMKKVKIYIFRV